MNTEIRNPSVVFAIGLARVLLSVLVVYAFLATLMTASAQQSISAALNDLRSGPDGQPATYSQAFIAYKKIRDLKAHRETVQTEHDRNERAFAAARKGYGKLSPQVSAESAAFYAFHERLFRKDLCELSENPKPEAWDAVAVCSREMPEREAQIWASLNARRPNFKAVTADLYAAQQAEEVARQDFEETRQRLEAIDKQIQANSVAGLFGDFDLLRKSWMAAGGLFEGFPPATLQILLAFMSGAFGALLIAQILIVYPENQLGLTKGEGFEARIGLGGMVAVCVYIILGSGAVLLGDSSSLEGDANVMTFAGVGVLAGMFSDRVAAWLSERANFFFEPRGKSDGEEEEAEDGKPKPPPKAPEKRART